MLDEFINDQPKTYKILTNQIKNNKVSHAYLFEINNYEQAYNLIYAFIKSLFCPHKYLNNKKCINCHQCENIDKKIYSEIEVINPDGLWIKKEQLLNLKKDFSKKSFVGNKKLYVINQAECLNSSSANTILKFLEEPEEGIYAILITQNSHKVLETIKSRCQIISLQNNFKKENKIYSMFNNNITKEDLSCIVEDAFSFVDILEKYKQNTIIYTKELVFDKYNNLEQIKNFLIIIQLIYKDLINLKIGKLPEYFEKEKLNEIQIEDNVEILIKKINVIITQIEKIDVNANLNLIIDKLIIDMEVK